MSIHERRSNRPGRIRGLARSARRWTHAQAIAAGLGILIVAGGWGVLVLLLRRLDEGTLEPPEGPEPGPIREALLEIPDPAFLWAFWVGEGLLLIAFVALLWTRSRRPRHAPNPGPRR